MKTQELIAEINDLPLEQRAEIATKILQGLNAPDQEIESVWLNEVEQRAAEVDSGEVKMIPGEQVMNRLKSITQK